MTDNIHVIETAFSPEGLEATVNRSGRMLAEWSTESNPLIGHVSIGVYKDGGYSCGFHMPDDAQHILGPTLFTAMVKEIIQRELSGSLSADDYAQKYLF